MELSHLLKLVAELPSNSTLNYVRSSDTCRFIDVDIAGERINSETPTGENRPWASTYLRELAGKIRENVPFNLSGLLNNKGSFRPVIETIIAHTREFYTVRKGSATALVWIPSKPKAELKLEEIGQNEIPAPIDSDDVEVSMAIINPLKDSYTKDELVAELKEMRDALGTTGIHLFGLKYGKFLADKQSKELSTIASDAGLSENFGAELNKLRNVYKAIHEHKFGVSFYDEVHMAPESISFTDLNQTWLLTYLRAIRTKPFVLLAGISGTGKSRIVRKLAQACWEPGSEEAKAHKPSNFEMVQVKPNWHDSSELLGYVSRINNEPQFIAGDFLKFIAKAWENPDVPYFLCLDEMNLAPVEQYFAEYLSVVESRKRQEDGKIVSDPILKKSKEDWFRVLCNELAENENIKMQFLNEGITIPQNLIVIGTVNMDETTYSFSRKVLDRAMTIEMNEVDLRGGLHKVDDMLPHIKPSQLLADAVEGFDVYEDNQESCDKAIAYLDVVNNVLDKTPFKVAYRTRNEFLIYVVNALKLAGEDADVNATIASALDEVTSMKILSRIEGDKRKVYFLDDLESKISDELNNISEGFKSKVSIPKLGMMKDRLKSGYTSFWD